MAQPRRLWKLPWGWYVALGLLMVTGIILIWLNLPVPPWVQQISQKVKPDTWFILLGIYLISITVSHVFVFYSVRLIRCWLNLCGEETTADLWAPALVGVCESIMYPTAWILGRADFIGVWLALKVAGQWVRWRGDGVGPGSFPSSEKLNEGRRRFNAFLVGSALSVMAGFATWAALKIWALS